MKPESEVQQEIQIEGPYHRSILLRNNNGACIDEQGNFVRYGLGNISKKHTEKITSSDLIGPTQVVITPEMVGKTIAVFTAIEVKKEDWDENKKFNAREKAQHAFIKWVKAVGGLAGFCNDATKLKDILRFK